MPHPSNFPQNHHGTTARGAQASSARARAARPRRGVCPTSRSQPLERGFTQWRARHARQCAALTSSSRGGGNSAQGSGSPTPAARMAVVPTEQGGGIVLGGTFDSLEGGSLRHHLARLTGAPAPGCPSVAASVTAPVVVGTYPRPVQAGQVLFTRTGDLSTPMTVSLAVSGSKRYSLAQALPETITFKAGKAKVRLALVPSDYAGAGGKVKLTLQSGRGYVGGSPGKANVPFTAP